GPERRLQLRDLPPPNPPPPGGRVFLFTGGATHSFRIVEFSPFETRRYSRVRMAHRFLPLLAALLLNAPAPTPPAAAPGAHDTTRPWVMEQAARAMSAASVGPLAPRGAV